MRLVPVDKTRLWSWLVRSIPEAAQRRRYLGRYAKTVYGYSTTLQGTKNA